MRGARDNPTIEGMPYVPGTVCASLSRAPRADSIWLTAQSELVHAHERPAGAVVVNGAPFSHVLMSLLARGVPTVLVSRTQAASLRKGDRVVLDGALGTITRGNEAPEASVPPPVPRALRTVDNVAVDLRASVRNASAARRARDNGASAIGLVRSEFLIPPGDVLPTADFYTQSLAELCDAADPLPITLRLLDIAPDKRPAWLGALSEHVTALGLQGVRLFDHEPVAGVVRAQLNAMSRLQSRRALRLIIPYVVSLAEIHHAREMIRAHLPKPILTGVMAETPAAALEIADFCEAADFVALGTNDLMQCLFAADRDEPAVANLLDPYAPVLYRFLRNVAENAGPHLARVQVCGVLSQLPHTLVLMLGLGYRVFSVDAVFLPYLAAEAARTDTERARALADEVCASTTSEDVRQAIALYRTNA